MELMTDMHAATAHMHCREQNTGKFFGRSVGTTACSPPEWPTSLGPFGRAGFIIYRRREI